MVIMKETNESSLGLLRRLSLLPARREPHLSWDAALIKSLLQAQFRSQ